MIRWLKSLSDDNKVKLIIAILPVFSVMFFAYFKFGVNYFDNNKFDCKKKLQEIEFLKIEIDSLEKSIVTNRNKADIRLKEALLKGKIKTYDKQCKNEQYRF